VNEMGSKPAGTGPPAGWLPSGGPVLNWLVRVVVDEPALVIVDVGEDVEVLADEDELVRPAGVVTVCLVAALLPPHAAKPRPARPNPATKKGASPHLSLVAPTKLLTCSGLPWVPAGLSRVPRLAARECSLPV